MKYYIFISLLFLSLPAWMNNAYAAVEIMDPVGGGSPVKLKMIQEKSKYCYYPDAAISSIAEGIGIGTDKQLTHYRFKVFHLQTTTGLASVQANLIADLFKSIFPLGEYWIPIEASQVWGQELTNFNVKFEGEGIEPVSIDFFKDGEIVYKERNRPSWMQIEKLGDLGGIGSVYAHTRVAFIAMIPVNRTQLQGGKATMTITSNGSSYYRPRWYDIWASWNNFKCSKTITAGAVR